MSSRCKTIIVRHDQQSKGEQLTFVAIGNRSQAKEEKGEKIHSVHLREEGIGRGEGAGGGIHALNRSTLEYRHINERTNRHTHRHTNYQYHSDTAILED